MAMTLERRKEIALAYVRYRIRKEGISTLQQSALCRAVGETAKGMGIPFEATLEFTQILVQEAVDEAFQGKVTPDVVKQKIEQR